VFVGRSGKPSPSELEVYAIVEALEPLDDTAVHKELWAILGWIVSQRRGSAVDGGAPSRDRPALSHSRGGMTSPRLHGLAGAVHNSQNGGRRNLGPPFSDRYLISS
jgi:hypothetical protein